MIERIRNGPPARYSVRVIRVDSLASAFPGASPTLHLVVGIHNEGSQPFRLESMSGALFFHGLYWNSYDQRQDEGSLVPARTELFLPVALLLTDTLAGVPDSLSPLRHALRAGSQHDSTLVLNVRVNVYQKDEVSYSADSYGKIYPSRLCYADKFSAARRRQKCLFDV